jgi:hypothetical protein
MMPTYGEIKNAIENGDYDAYTDRVDCTMEISLFEYGIIRNPETNECIFSRYLSNEEPNDDEEIELNHVDVSLADVRGYLIDESSQGFFSYIGSDLETELDRLDNENLASIINSINMYDGWFNN